jgi:ethanolamine utilization protein EutN
VILGRVVGEVWATRKHGRLVGQKLLVVRPYAWYAPAHEVEHLVAIDPKVDAGVGDDVIVCMGGPPRWQSEGDATPVDAAVLAVVDRLEIDESAFEGPRPLELLGGSPPTLEVGRIRTAGADDGEGAA